MLLLILRGLNHNTSYKEYPIWATYIAITIVIFVIYLLIKGRNKK